MPVATVDNLVDLIQQHDLLLPEQFEELNGDLAARFPSPVSLAKELLRRDWLTAFQINLLFTDRGSELVQGDYLLLERLGGGGMGQVHKARHLQHGFVAALKLLHPQRAASAEMVRRFRREMAAAARLDHPNIVHTADLKEKDGILFFAMEFLQGIDLFKLVKQRGALNPVEACDYARQAALGLQHAHEHNLVHRDIKPSNLFLTGGERTIKILDFGLTRLDDAEGGLSASVVTKDGHVMGTPDYIAPEQARHSHSADSRADLYSLGCTLYFLLTARVPFPKGSMTEKLIQHQVDHPISILELRPETPPAVAAIVQKLMAKDPADRYQTAAEVAQALTTGPDQETMANLILPDWPLALPLDTSEALHLESTIAETFHSNAPLAQPVPPPRRDNRQMAFLVAGAFAFSVLVLGTLMVVKWLLH